METLRTSSYIIPVKLESEEGKYMLIHGYTGAVDIVTEDLLEEIKNINSVSNLSSDTLQILKERGYITTKSQSEEYTYVARIAKALHRKCEVLSTVFTWVVTYNCNFRCPYCFESRKIKMGMYELYSQRKWLIMLIMLWIVFNHISNCVLMLLRFMVENLFYLKIKK